MKMPTTTNIKVEAKASAPVEDAAKQCLNCLEKKVRNLEKRKGRIEQNQEKAKKGTKLEKEQEVSLDQYEQVTHDLEFARELQKQFTQINQDHEKIVKKQTKREKAERQLIEITRIGEILKLQSLLDSLGGDKVREDFKTGKHGAVVLTEDNLNQLDELYQAISPSRDDSGDEYPQKLNEAADHLVNILDGKDRQVAGTTYKEIKELITLINDCGYFERARLAEAAEEVVLESNQETEESPEPAEEPEGDDDASAEDEEEEEAEQPQPQQQQQQPIDLTMGTADGVQSQLDLAAQPLNTLEQDAFFAPSSTSYQPEPEPQYSQQQSHASATSRVPDFQSFTHNRPFQFIQTSYVMPDSSSTAPAVVDPAVIVAQPAVTSSLQFMSQGFEAGHQAPPQQQQQPQSVQQQQQQQHQQSSSQSVGVPDLSQSGSSLHQQQQQQSVPPQQQQQPQAQDYNSQNFAQAGLSQTLQTADSLFPTPPSAVEDVSNSLSSHSGMMGQMREDGVSTSPYEIPPSIPMPPSQSQDQSQLTEQQQQDKKFQMSVNAPVFQSMYAQQVAQGQAVPVSVPPPSAPSGPDTHQAPPPSSDFTNTPTPSGDFGQASGDFQQGYQANNGFPNGGGYRGNRGGYRGGRGGSGGNGGNRNGGPGGAHIQNGFGGRGGGANSNNSRGGARGGTYQGYPPSNNYRPDSFQGGYNASGFGAGGGGGFQKRGGMSPSGPGAGYPRGGAGGSGGRGGASGGMRGGMQRGGGGVGGPRGAPRGGGFGRPMPTQ